ELVIGDRLQARQSIGRAAVAANPDKAFAVDVDAVFALDPFVAWAVAAPALDKLAVLVEHHHGRCGLRHFLGLERAWAGQHEGLALRIDGDAGDVAGLPL